MTGKTIETVEKDTRIYINRTNKKRDDEEGTREEGEYLELGSRKALSRASNQADRIRRIPPGPLYRVG